MSESRARFAPLAARHAAEAAALIREAFAEQDIDTDPPSSALKETAEIVAAKLIEGGGAGAFEGEALIGLILWTPQPDALYLGRLAVSGKGRGQGLGGRLLQLALEEAKRRGYATARLNVRIDLPRNQALFARAGFVEVARRAHPGYDRPTFIVMERRSPD